MEAQSSGGPGRVGAQSEGRAFYKIIWRWHFYAGLYVAPFLIMLAVTGLAMLYADKLERWVESDAIYVESLGEQTSLEVQKQTVLAAFPDSRVREYVLPKTVDEASRFSVTTAEGNNIQALVNPYTGELTGQLDRDGNLYNLATEIHGTLMVGVTGDRLIEVAASFGVLLIVSGLYLWWPRDKAARAGFLRIRTSIGRRTFWRDLHANVGGITAVFLLLFLLSGLAWAGVWGAKLVQPWNSFPAGVFGNAPLSDASHADMDHTVEKTIPWNLEQTPLPLSGSVEGIDAIGGDVNLDSVQALAEQLGFTGYRIKLPGDESGVYSIVASTMSNDISDATQDRTVHIDQYTGKVLADIQFQDYAWLGKVMAFGIALHEGDMGLLNLVANTLLCLSFVLLPVSGVVMWWKRRPKGTIRLSAPPLPASQPHIKGAMVVFIALSLLFPLAAVTLIALLVMDYLVFTRLPAMKRALN